MADQIATGVQWVVDDSTGAITGYRRKINGVDTQFQASVSGGGGGLAYDSVTISATTTAIRGAACQVAGFAVNSSSSGRWRLYDALTATGTPFYDSGVTTQGQTITLPAPVSCFIGLTAELVSGTGNITIVVR